MIEPFENLIILVFSAYNSERARKAKQKSVALKTFENVRWPEPFLQNLIEICKTYLNMPVSQMDKYLA